VIRRFVTPWWTAMKETAAASAQESQGHGDAFQTTVK
jgi:hypothetical protein